MRVIRNAFFTSTDAYTVAKPAGSASCAVVRERGCACRVPRRFRVTPPPSQLGSLSTALLLYILNVWCENHQLRSPLCLTYSWCSTVQRPCIRLYSKADRCLAAHLQSPTYLSSNTPFTRNTARAGTFKMVIKRFSNMLGSKKGMNPFTRNGGGSSSDTRPRSEENRNNSDEVEAPFNEGMDTPEGNAARGIRLFCESAGSGVSLDLFFLGSVATPSARAARKAPNYSDVC